MDRNGHRKKAAFLAAYAACGNISGACRAAEVARSMYYVWTEHDADFAIAARQAYEEAGDRLEAVAHERATIGVETVKEVYKGEKLVRREVSRTISDTMLAMLLNGAKPEKYKRRLEHSGTVSAGVKAIDREAYEAV